MPAVDNHGRDPGIDGHFDCTQFRNHTANRKAAFVAVRQFFCPINVADEWNHIAVLVEQTIDPSQDDQQVRASEGGDSAERRSLSPKLSSSVATESFSLIIGTIFPADNRRSRVLPAFARRT